MTSLVSSRRKTSAVRKWVVENSDGDSHHLFRTIYDGAYTHLTGPGVMRCSD